MPIRVKRFGSAFSVLLLAAFTPWTAISEVAEVDEADRWVPALALSSGLLFQDVEASIESGPVMGPSFLPTPQPIRPADRGDTLMISPDVGIALEVMTPRVVQHSWAPRFFVHGGVSGAFGPHQDVAKEGVIEDLDVASGLPAPKDDAVTGQGSRTRAQIDKLLVRAGAGVALSVDALGRRLRVRASIEYLREEIEVQGAVRRAVCIVPDIDSPLLCGARPPPTGGGIDDFREIDLRKTKTKDFHGIGPGIELETDVGRIGPIVPSISIGAQFFRFVGSRKISITTSNEFGESLSASFKKDPWAYRAGVGVRLRWIPE